MMWLIMFAAVVFTIWTGEVKYEARNRQAEEEDAR